MMRLNSECLRVQLGIIKNIVKKVRDDRSCSAPQHVYTSIMQAKSTIKDTRIGDKDDWDLSNIIKKCEQNNINIAVSNPCFEIWILLHHLSSQETANLSKFPTCNLVLNEIKRDDYHASKKRPIRKKIFNDLQLAVNNAKVIYVTSESGIPTNPGTQMHFLVEEFLNRFNNQ